MDDGIAQPGEIDAFCRRELGGSVARVLARAGRVTALALADGRRVVVTAYGPERTFEALAEIVRVQMHLASRGVLAPTVCGGPAPFARGLAIVEALVERGVVRDGREPAVVAAPKMMPKTAPRMIALAVNSAGDSEAGT